MIEWPQRVEKRLSEPGVGRQIFTTSPRLTARAGRSPPRSRQHEVHIPAATFRAHEPLVPFRDWGVGAVTSRQLGRARLDLMPAIAAPNDYSHLGCRRAVESCWWAAVGFHPRRRYRPLLGGS